MEQKNYAITPYQPCLVMKNCYLCKKFYLNSTGIMVDWPISVLHPELRMKVYFCKLCAKKKGINNHTYYYYG